MTRAVRAECMPRRSRWLATLAFVAGFAPAGAAQHARADTMAMLAPVEVRDSAAPPRDPTGFEQRRRSGHGLYLTQREIEGRHAIRVEHLLGQLPGIQVDTAGVVRADRGRTSLFGDNCRDGVQLFVDGVAVSADFSLRNLMSTALRGIEVYRGVASTPVELRSPRTVCGTVAIWTK